MFDFADSDNTGTIFVCFNVDTDDSSAHNMSRDTGSLQVVRVHFFPLCDGVPDIDFHVFDADVPDIQKLLPPWNIRPP